jgi:hypothetical protein
MTTQHQTSLRLIEKSQILKFRFASAVDEDSYDVFLRTQS